MWSFWEVPLYERLWWTCRREYNLPFLVFQIVIIGSYVIAAAFFSVYSMAVDTLFLCFCKSHEQRPGSTLAQIMIWYLTAPSHYLNQCTLIIKGVLLHSPESNFTSSTYELHNICSDITLLKVLLHLPGSAWPLRGVFQKHLWALKSKRS